jgi:hypothetical protein
MSKRPTNEQLVTIIGGMVLFSFVALSWLPQPCPVIKRALTICPAHHPLLKPPTEEETTLASVSHQDILTDGYFAIKSQENRSSTTVNFQYAGDLAADTAYLAVNKKDAGYQFVALVTQPLLATLSWPKISLNEYTIFQRNGGDFSSMDDFLKHLPAASSLALDSVAARTLGLDQHAYVSLDALASLDNIQTIITTYSTPLTSETWHSFSRKLDLTDAALTKDNKIEWHLSFLQNPDPKKPFHLGTVHVDYGQIFQK